MGGPIPEGYDHGNSFARHLDGWELRLWTDDSFDGPWFVGDLARDAKRYAPNDHVRFRVDVLRLEILWRYGGIYVDCDAVCLRPLDPLLDRGAFVAETPNKPGTATNAVMGAQPKHPYIGELLAGLHGRAEQMAGARVVESVGGLYLTETLARHPDVDLAPWWQFAGQSISDRRKNRPRDPRNVQRGYVDHLYGNTRSRDG